MLANNTIREDINGDSEAQEIAPGGEFLGFNPSLPLT
jgi:hypothetical protein